MTAPVSREPRTGPVLIFELGAGTGGNEGAGVFGLHVSQLLQVIEPAVLSPVPLAPPVVLGIMSHRGRIVTVVDPAPLLSSSARPVVGSDTRIVLLRHGQRSTGNVGLQVGRVREIAPTSELKEISVSPGSGIGWVAQRGRLLVNIVEVEPLLEGLAHAFGSEGAAASGVGVSG